MLIIYPEVGNGRLLNAGFIPLTLESQLMHNTIRHRRVSEWLVLHLNLGYTRQSVHWNFR